MSDCDRHTWWLFSAMLALPVISFVFSPDGLLQLRMIGLPGFGFGHIWSWLVWLSLGLIATTLLSYMAVRRWGAPTRIWVIALAFSILRVLRMLVVVIPLSVTPPGLADVGGLLGRVVYPPYHGPEIYFAATIGYVLAAFVGCTLAARVRLRAGESESAHLTSASS